ncbi:MAG: hypothetical protein HY744_00525 [Deltaproteobacteria bacterium]|nr:hypothetical protein [Deltaproteobacteria bacterium]
MSASRHATVSAWQRDEDGSYRADLHGSALRVKWSPAEAAGRGSFGWTLEPTGGEKVEDDERFEEPERCMAAAERAAEGMAKPEGG